jgi:uncharacterized membrane protein
MEILLLLTIVILAAILLNHSNKNTESVDRLSRMIAQLHKEIFELKTSLKPNEPVNKTEIIKPVEEIKPTIQQEIIRLIEHPKEQIQHHKPFQERITEPFKEKEVIEKIQYEQKPAQFIKEENWFDKWVKNNPDIEKFIGENLINKIGIAVLVLGIAFFVKYAIDQNWIKEGGRVAIGILCGAILIGIAHWLRNTYRSFSSVLVGGGITVFYFTIAFAFHQYHMMEQSKAFVIMVIITAFAIALSVFYNRIELAIIATIGGFITPFLVATGSGNYIVLFTYLCILNAGIIAMAYLKQWRILQIIAFAFTTIIYGGWLAESFYKTNFSVVGAISFATIFYLMFIVMSLLHHVKKQYELKALDFTIFLLINLAFFATGITVLSKPECSDYKGLFTASIALLNIALGYTLNKQKLVDKKFIYLLIGLALSFTSLIGPIQLDGNYITLFWFTEIVLLFWLYQKINISLFKIFSSIITALAVISLLIDWADIYSNNQTSLAIIFNKGFITSIFAAVGLFATNLLFKKEANTFFILSIPTKTVKGIYFILSIVCFFIGGLLEINHQFSQHYPNTEINTVYMLLFTYLFTLVLNNIYHTLIKSIKSSIVIGLITGLLLLFLFSCYDIYETLQQMLLTGNNKIHFIGYLTLVASLFTLLFAGVKNLRQNEMNDNESISILAGLSVAQWVVLLSVFGLHLYVWIMFTNQQSIAVNENNFERAGLSIIWGISSFIVMWLGMKKSKRILRVIALSLFAITLLKLFLYDISNMSPGGKIAAFILLGVLLLIVSFMYQRLKKILIDDAKDAKTEL